MQSKPVMIGISGGNDSGKKEICQEIIDTLQLKNPSLKIIHLQMEEYYKPLSPIQLKLVRNNEFNLYVPDAIDFELLHHDLKSISGGETTMIPMYDFQEYKR